MQKIKANIPNIIGTVVFPVLKVVPTTINDIITNIIINTADKYKKLN